MATFLETKSDYTVEQLIEMAETTWSVVELAILTADKVLLWGPPGTGKTTAAYKVGNPSDVYKVTLHEEMPAAEIEGHFIPVEGDFEWHDGLGIRAWRGGARLLADEIDRSSGDVQTMMYAIGDDPEVAELALPTGEIVKPEDGFQFIATMNGHPNDLPPALRDRFDVSVEVNLPHPGVIETLSEDLRDVARRDIFSPERISSSVRRWKAFDKMRGRNGSSDMDVAKLVWGDREGTKIMESVALASA